MEGCGMAGQTVMRLTKFIGWIDNQIFLAMGLHLHMICSTKKLYWMLSLYTFFQVLGLLA